MHKQIETIANKLSEMSVEYASDMRQTEIAIFPEARAAENRMRMRNSGLNKLAGDLRELIKEFNLLTEQQELKS